MRSRLRWTRLRAPGGAALGLALAAAVGCRTSCLHVADLDGCGNLTGTWHDAEQPSYRYRVEDSGLRVLARPLSAEGAPAVGAERDGIELTCGPRGLVGITRQTGSLTFPNGEQHTCTVEFSTRLLHCKPRSLELEVEQSGGVLPDCRRLEESAPDVARHVWIRD